MYERKKSEFLSSPYARVKIGVCEPFKCVVKGYNCFVKDYNASVKGDNAVVLSDYGEFSGFYGIVVAVAYLAEVNSRRLRC